MIKLDYLKDRLFAEVGLEIWKYHNDFLVVTKDTRYGKFYSMRKYSFEQVKEIDPAFRQRINGVKVKRDPSILDQK